MRNANSKKIGAARLTWQATQRDKLGFYMDYTKNCSGSAFSQRRRAVPRPGRRVDGIGSGHRAGRADQLTGVGHHLGRARKDHAGHLLGAAGRAASWWRLGSRRSGPSGATSVRPAPLVDQIAGDGTDRRRRPPGTPTSNFIYHGWPATGGTQQQNAQYRAALSYVTGSHSVKVGYQGALHDGQDARRSSGQQISYRFNNGVPNQLTQRLGPTLTSNRTVPDAFYVAGPVDALPPDAAGRPALRARAQLLPRGRERRRRGRTASAPAFTFPRTEGVKRLQRHHAAHGRLLRRVRQRQDGDQGQHEQVPAGRLQRRRLHHQQPGRDAAVTTTSRGWTRRRQQTTASPTATS